MFTPSSSSLVRFVRCAASHALPRIGSVTDRAERGTALHKYLDAMVVEKDQQRLLAALQTVPSEWRDTASHLDITEAIEGILEPSTEVSFALNVETGQVRILGHHLDRQYADRLGPGEIPGTSDVSGIRADGVPVILDWKSGNHVGDLDLYDQTKFFALCATRLNGNSPLVEVRIGYVKETGHIEVESHEFNLFELDDYAALIKQSHRRLIIADQKYLSTGEVDAVTGAHCSYCPSIQTCPPHTQLAKSMLPELDEIASNINEMSDPQAARAWSRYKTIDRLLSRVGESLKMRAKTLQIPLGNGMVVGPISCKRRTFSEKAALQLLRERGTSESEIRSLYKEIRYVKITELKDKT